MCFDDFTLILLLQRKVLLNCSFTIIKTVFSFEIMTISTKTCQQYRLSLFHTVPLSICTTDIWIFLFKLEKSITNLKGQIEILTLALHDLIIHICWHHFLFLTIIAFNLSFCKKTKKGTFRDCYQDQLCG